jgi:lysophospholipase L1-like esterase
MTDRNGKINRDIFVEDRLHMNRQGYEIWKKAITPYLLKD